MIVKPFLKPVDTKNVQAMTADGEVYTAEKRFRIVQENMEEFFLTYNYLAGYVNGCDSLADLKLLNWITNNLDYNHGMVTLNKYYKEKIVESTKLAMSTIERSIAALRKAEILVPDKTCPRCAIYHVNPTYVWKGDRDKRKPKLKFVLELLNYDKMPDKEQKLSDDIQRYMDHVKANES